MAPTWLPAESALPKVAEQTNLRANLEAYALGFCDNVRDIFEQVEIDKTFAKLASANLLYLVAKEFAAVDERTATIDALITECRALITLLKERRSALITAAVTGQLDVRQA